MKRTITAITLALASLAAHAGIIATSNNQSGGRIELSDIAVGEGIHRACTANMHIAKSWGRGSDLYGCWFYDETARTVTIIWLENTGTDYHTYPLDGFTFTPYFRRLQKGDL